MTEILCGCVVLSQLREWRVETPGTESSQFARSQRGQRLPGYPDEARRPIPAGDRGPNDREYPIVQKPMLVADDQIW